MQNTAARLLILNAALTITADPTMGEGLLGVRQGADVLIVGDSIARVGDGIRAAGARTIDADGCIVMPGFVDVHDHLWQSLIRGRGADQELPQWLAACVFALAAATITREESQAAVRIGALSLATGGVTTVVDWSHTFNPAFTDGNIAALADSGMRFVFGHSVYSPAMAEEAARIRLALAALPRAMGLHVCSHPSLSLQSQLETAAGFAGEHDLTLDVHFLEHQSQRADEPLAALRATGAVGRRLFLDHAVHATDAEIALLAEAGARVSHNPLSNLRLASGIMPLAKWHAAGAKVGLGLDGGTNDTPDMFNNMRVAVGLQRALAKSVGTYPGVADALRMATIGGAEALGLEDRIGSLTPGKLADVIVVDPSGVNFAPRGDLVSQLVFCGQPANVRDVIVGGRVLKRCGRLAGVAVKEAVRDAERAAASVWGRARG
ncbi:MAG: amidohydrolase family protein [SAR202 cluster bacterium]|nr:amidohydrolase family protein [SAR202 cluster bacterium]